MKAWLGIGVVLLLIAAAAGGYIYSQDSRLKAQEQTIKEQGESIGILTTANIAQNATIRQLREFKQIESAIVTAAADRSDSLSTIIQNLDRKAQEALRNAPNLTLDSLLPPDAADALCLQWHEASGRSGSAANQGNAAVSADARAANSRSSDCGRWRRMTVRAAVEWTPTPTYWKRALPWLVFTLPRLTGRRRVNLCSSPARLWTISAVTWGRTSSPVRCSKILLPTKRRASIPNGSGARTRIRGRTTPAERQGHVANMEAKHKTEGVCG